MKGRAFLAEQVGRRHGDVAKEQLRSVGLSDADLFELAPPAEAGHSLFDYDQRQPCSAIIGPVRGSHNNHDASVVSSCNERFGAVEDVAASVAFRGGADAS